MSTTEQQKPELTLPTRPKADEKLGVVEMGAHLKSMFLMADGYRNMNNGSFGTIPRAIQSRQRSYQDLAEARPDPFIRYEYSSFLDQSREAVADLINAPVEGTVFVANATTGVNVVLRSLAGEWAIEDAAAAATNTGEDKTEAEEERVKQQQQQKKKQNEILYFSTIYPGCGKSIDYVVDTSGDRIAGREILLNYPCSDAEVVRALADGIRKSREEGRVPRLAVFDVVSSLPGVCVPYPALVRLCREEGVMSLVDGAQGVGMVQVDVRSSDPDFFVSNCHKWLHVPRGCAVFYVAQRCRALVKSTLPTSHGYEGQAKPRFSPLPPEEKKSKWVKNFEFVGTIDNAPYLCVKDAIAWRKEVLGGEERILAYLHALAREGGKKAAQIVGTGEVLDNDAGSLTGCAMVNVALPLVLKGVDAEWASSSSPSSLETSDAASLAVFLDPADATTAINWMLRTLINKYGTFVAMYVYRKKIWARISAQVFLDIKDFEETGRVLREVCESVGRGEWMDGAEVKGHRNWAVGK